MKKVFYVLIVLALVVGLYPHVAYGQQKNINSGRYSTKISTVKSSSKQISAQSSKKTSKPSTKKVQVKTVPVSKSKVSQAAVKPVKTAQTVAVNNSTYNRQWYQNDREHFATLLHTAKTSSQTRDTLYREYLSLINQREKIEAKAYHSPKGYTIYSPAITEELNTLQLAIQARSLLLRDIMLNKVRDLDSYYDKDYRYLVTGSQNTFPDIVPVQKNNFDLNKIVNTINSLPIPSRLLYGQKIWYINGRPNKSSVAGFNAPGVLGNFDGRIVVYNSSDLPGVQNTLLGTTLHEVGHNVANAIFQYNSQDPTILNNRRAVQQYARIYNMRTYSNKGPWKDKISENFAEDFKNIFCGEKKHPAVWQGEHKKEVRSFMDQQLKTVDLNKFYLKGYKLVTSAGSFSHFYNPYDSFGKAETFVVNSDKADVYLDGINIASKNPVVIVSAVKNNVTEEDVFFGETEGNKCHIKFPQKGVYEVQIWIDDCYISPGFNFYVVYGDYKG